MHDAENLLRVPGFTQALRQSVDDLEAEPLLRDAKIKLTSRCNLRCRMCSYGFTRGETALATAQWQRVLDEIAELGGRKVHFSGGEVYLRRDFPEILRHSVGLGLKTCLTTNATLVDRARARELAEARVHGVSVSLDAPNASLHDRIRGVGGSFARTVRAVRSIVREAGSRRRPRVRINFVLMQDNYRLLPEMHRLASDLGAIDLNPMPVDEQGKRRHRLSRRQIQSYNREIAPVVLDLRQRFGFSTAREKVYPFGTSADEIRHARRGDYALGQFERHPCLAPWLHLFLAWDGNAYLCCMTNGRMKPLGNVAESPVRAVFSGSRYRAVRAEFRAGRQLPACARCDLFPRENRALVQALGL